MNLLRFDDGPIRRAGDAVGPDRRDGRRRLRRDLSPQGREGRGVRAEVPAPRGAFRHRHPPRQSRAAAMAQHLRLPDQEYRRARRDLPQVSQRRPDDPAAGVRDRAQPLPTPAARSRISRTGAAFCLSPRTRGEANASIVDASGSCDERRRSRRVRRISASGHDASRGGSSTRSSAPPARPSAMRR